MPPRAGETLERFRGEVRVCGTVDDVPRRVEARAVTRAVPRALRAVPRDDAAQVRTHRRVNVHGAGLVLVDRELLEPMPHQRAAAGGDLLGALHFRWLHPI